MGKKLLSIILIFAMLLGFAACSVPILEYEVNDTEIVDSGIDDSIEIALDENAQYTSAQDVALYIHTYDKLPSNYITKGEAMDLGWESSKGNLWDVTDNMSIGGDKFGNREGILPKEVGRIYYEADINYQGGFRGAERIVFSNDGLIFYTEDHYETFKQLY